jgi:hypothetical protein
MSQIFDPYMPWTNTTSHNSDFTESKNTNFDFSEVELAVRRWAAQTGHDTDQSNYAKMKEMYE